MRRFFVPGDRFSQLTTVCILGFSIGPAVSESFDSLDSQRTDRNPSLEGDGGVAAAVRELSEATNVVPLSERIEICEQCLSGIGPVAAQWAQTAAAAKGVPGASGVMAEDLLSGPVVVARQLLLTIQTLERITQTQQVPLPGRISIDESGRVLVPVFPTSGNYDSLTFFGLAAIVRMQEGVTADSIHGALIQQAMCETFADVSAVLGAGNVSSIPALDSLNRIMFEGRRVVLKLNPVNEYLAEPFEAAFRPLIERNLLRIIKGGVHVGAELTEHPQVSDVHITGSAQTHDRIVWGSPEQQATRKAKGRPLLQKPITSELGNVSPWIVVPGNYSSRQLNSQAQHLAASITNNASFNCLATKVIVTSSQWGQRDRFLALVQHHLQQTPARPAHYPGAADRFRRFAASDIQPDESNCLPWTLLLNQSIEERPELFQEESFVCVCAETGLDVQSPERFLEAAVEFVNERLFGTLCCSVTVPNGLQRRSPDVFRRAINQLRYGATCVNQWSGLAYGLISPPWGAYPGAALTDVGSGVGNVHNTLLLDRPEKTILSGPLVNLPKPIWFPSHRNAYRVAESLLDLYLGPSVTKLPKLLLNAIQG